MADPMQRADIADVWDTALMGPYLDWRAQKLAQIENSVVPVEIRDLAKPTKAEQEELVRQCRNSNAVFYVSDGNVDPGQVRISLRGFAVAIGLEIAEKHRSAGHDGIVALKQSNTAGQRGYIPYSKKPMNWHTDGYYNAADQKIRAMVLHCVKPAIDGGVNQFFDPEIAYIRLRDENPGYIDALTHACAMTIPENRENDGSIRPASVGPVFSVDAVSGKLEMRYTARTRSIVWRDDDLTVQAVQFLNTVLNANDLNMKTIRFQAGEGVLCNNSLHNRTGFDSSLSEDSVRLIYRVRFHNRVKGS